MTTATVASEVPELVKNIREVAAAIESGFKRESYSGLKSCVEDLRGWMARLDELVSEADLKVCPMCDSSELVARGHTDMNGDVVVAWRECYVCGHRSEEE